MCDSFHFARHVVLVRLEADVVTALLCLNLQENFCWVIWQVPFSGMSPGPCWRMLVLGSLRGRIFGREVESYRKAEKLKDRTSVV